MKKVPSLTVLLLIITAITLSGCTIAVNGEQRYFYERPAIGITVQDEVVTNVEIEKQSRISLNAQDGIIKITSWDRDYIQILERRELKGPASKESLKALLENSKCNVESTTFDIKLKKEPDKDLKPFFRRIDDIELMVPESLKTINIVAKSGRITMSGFKDMSVIDIKLEKGRIKVETCAVNKINTAITVGDLDIVALIGSGTYKGGKGDIKLKDITGDIELKSVSGDTYIENAEGKLNCDISTGSITVKNSRLKTESMLYATYGDISVDFQAVDTSGKYTIKASQGNIQLNLLEKTGWSLLAKVTKGQIVDNVSLPADELKKAPSGEVYGDIGGGGPTIDAYVDRGNIFLLKKLR